MVGLGRVAGSRTDALIFFVNEFGLSELPRTFDSPGHTSTVVKEFGKGLGEAVGDGLHHDRFVNVVCLTKFGGPFVRSVDPDDKASEVVIFISKIVR